jgi:hypothetical protein
MAYGEFSPVKIPPPSGSGVTVSVPLSNLPPESPHSRIRTTTTAARRRRQSHLIGIASPSAPSQDSPSVCASRPPPPLPLATRRSTGISRPSRPPAVPALAEAERTPSSEGGIARSFAAGGGGPRLAGRTGAGWLVARGWGAAALTCSGRNQTEGRKLRGAAASLRASPATSRGFYSPPFGWCFVLA